MQVLGVDLSLLGQVTDEPTMDVVNRSRTDALPAQGARRWQRTVDYLTTTVLGDDETSAHPLVLSQARRLLAATAIAVFDPAAATEHTRDRIDATPEVIRRAIAYMETNQDLDISVADIARAGRVGVRALQLAFRRHLDTTPLAYLRTLRLDQVRAQLVAADPGTGATVLAIAARWGFTRPAGSPSTTAPPTASYPVTPCTTATDLSGRAHDLPRRAATSDDVTRVLAHPGPRLRFRRCPSSFST